MYKIFRTTESYFYLNSLKIDNEDIISADRLNILTDCHILKRMN